MKLHQLKISNFLSIKSATVSLADRGLVLVLGENKDASTADSNGAGKSSIFDALCWCLWGQTVRGLRGDDVVNNQTKKDCSVSITLTEGGQDYTATRYRKHSGSDRPNDLRLSVDGKDITAPSVAATQELVNDVLGLDFVTFCTMQPGALVKASEMTDKEIKQLLEKLLQTGVVGKAHTHTREILKELERERETVELHHTHVQEKISEYDDQLEIIVTSHANYAVHKETKLLRLKDKSAALKAAMGTMLADSIDELEDDLGDAETRQAYSSLKLKEKQEELEDLRKEYRPRLEGHQVSIKSTEMYIDALLPAYLDTCVSCGQTISAIHKHQQEQYLIAHKEILAEEEQTYTALTKTLESLEEIILIESAKLDKDYSAEEQNIAAIEKSIKEYRVNVCMQGEVADIESECAALKQEVNPFTPIIDGLMEKMKVEINKGIDFVQQEKTLDDKIALHSFWVNGFSPQGLQSFMLEHVTPLLNIRVKEYCDLLTNGEMEINFSTKTLLKNKEVKDKFNIEVKQKHGGDTYDSNSTGERSRANIAIAFALGDLAAMRSNKKIPFKFLDEPFEYIDEAGIDSVMNLLNMHKDKYETVFVITHKNYFKQLFSSKMTIIKENGFSKLEEGL